jgi:RNA polymerase sigma-70 factor (ECF subfamily)
MAADDSTQWPREPLAHRIDWPAVLAEHGRWLRTVLLARVGDPQAVDDVMQDVQLGVLENGPRLRDPTKLAPWLYRVAVRTALAYRRRMGRRRKLLARYVERLPTDDVNNREADPLGWLLAAERQALVRQALANLPRREAEILLLKYTEAWTYRQIAEHLGSSESAVEARLHRARQRLRKELTVRETAMT